MENIPLTVLITTYNEADHLPELLGSLDWVDDILVVDSFSEDGTPEIARRAGVRLEQRTYTGPADQKNWAIPQAKYPWVLILDADERVPDALKLEIEQLLRDQPDKDVYWIGRRNFFMGQEVRYSGWQGDRVIRLIHRDKGRYNDLQVHEEIKTEGLQVGRLNNKMIHYTFKSLTHFLDKMRRYARWSAQDYADKTGRVTGWHLLVKPTFRFWKHYIWQGGFRDGRVGLIVSMILSWGVFLRYLYLIELRKKRT